MLEAKPPTERLKLTICYQGTNYHGWQIQKEQNPPDTIQGWLEWALAKLTGQKINVIGSGRTDSGVHALGQIAHCDVPKDLPINWQKSLNAVLPNDIQVLAVSKVDANFHARFSAHSKTYLYHFWTEKRFLPPQRAPYVWACGEIDLEAMRQCLPYILGSHDFTSFRNVGTPTLSCEREIFQASLDCLPPNPYLPAHSQEICFKVTANGFLKQMVRNLAGFLFLVGRKQSSPKMIPEIFKLKDRAKIPYRTAPAKGLTLACVIY
ncbi:MAG: tRNA pseudouridine(38-40) synthase TruA [Desulfovibrionaceae bacterium]|nr:tRNA pseudouridine(38-40) synthase TruA [Desulfovibrionaceae bacterium]